MGSLEETLSRVKALTLDQIAERIIGTQTVTKQLTRYETDEDMTARQMNAFEPDCYRGRLTIPYQAQVEEAIIRPDTAKREAAKRELKEIYDSSGWYSARYQSGVALEESAEKLSGNVQIWTNELRKIFEESDETRKLETLRDIGELLIRTKRDRNTGSDDVISLLKECYINPDSTIRVTSGGLLGYSKVRIWAHEHPVVATVTGIATVGAAAEIIYTVIDYLCK